MNYMMIAVILWIPFVIVAAICVSVFCTAGYRRGLWNAFVSLAATFAALFCSIFIARLLSEPISKPIEKALMAAAGEGTYASMAPTLLHGFLCVFMAMLIYFILLLILTILFKYLAKLLWGEKLQRSGGAMGWGGFLVRLVDGVVYTLLLLLPLYGTLGVIMPAVTAIAAPSEKESGDYQIVTTVAEHPVVRISGSEPMKVVYSRLAVVPTQSGNISIAELADGVTGTAERYQALKAAMETGDMSMEQIRDLVSFAREEVVYQEWFYAGYREALKQIPRDSYEDDPFAQEFMTLLDMDRKSFSKNMDAILSVAEYALNENIPLLIQENPDQAFEIFYSSGLMERIGAMINVSEESTALRNLLVKQAIMNICGDDKASANRLIAAYSPQRNQDGDSQIRDAEAMLMIAGVCDGNRKLDQYEALLRLPGFDQSVLYDHLSSLPKLQEEYAYGVLPLVAALEYKYGHDITETDLIWVDMVAESQKHLSPNPIGDSTNTEQEQEKIVIITIG
ncbi:MAG: hypothetical protein ACI3W5_05145 [Faecousia sp.]